MRLFSGRNMKFIRKKDIVLILSLLLVAAGILFWQHAAPGQNGTAVVEKDGTEVGRYDLGTQKKSQIIDVGGSMHVKLLLEPGAISFYHSDCPDQICVRTGKLTKPGQAAVCLPGRGSIRVVSNGGSPYDGYTG